jgi:hypothetical protein
MVVRIGGLLQHLRVRLEGSRQLLEEPVGTLQAGHVLGLGIQHSILDGHPVTRVQRGQHGPGVSDLAGPLEQQVGLQLPSGRSQQPGISVVHSHGLVVGWIGSGMVGERSSSNSGLVHC